MYARRFTPFLAIFLIVGCGESEPNVTTTPDAGNDVATAGAQSPPGVSSRIPPDERLHYIELDERSNFGGRLVRGDRVDIIAAFPKDEEQAAMATTLLQNVSVLDVEQPNDDGTGRVGVSLTADEVRLIIAAEMTGRFALLARNPEDMAVEAIGRTGLREALEDLEVLQKKRQARAAKVRPAESRGETAGGRFVHTIPVEERGFGLKHGFPAERIRAGDRVDIIGAGGLRDVATTLLQNVTVIEPLTDSTVVVAVTTSEAELLLLARERLRLTVVLRHREDVEVSTLQQKTLRSVLSDLEVIQEKRQIRVRRKPKKAKAPMIEIIQGDGGGGVAGPSAAVAGTEKYADYGVNAFTSTSEDPLSTFAVDVDTGSYTIARSKIDAGTLPPPESVRVEEFVNYFAYDYREPRRGPFRVSTEVASSPFDAEGKLRLLRVGVQGKTIAPRDREPLHLTLLVDVSGSMRNRLPLVQRSLRHLVDHLHGEDTVAISTYAGRTEVVLEPTVAEHRTAILDAIGDLRSGGGTNMGDGLKLAYGLAEQTLERGHESRVIVLSDGDANIGRTGWEAMLAEIRKQVDAGITMSTIGFGMGNYNDTAMEQLANNGNGNYYYVDSFAEAKRVFGEQVDGTLHTIAKDVKLQVEFDPEVVKRYRLVGYENRDVADRDFRNDEVDAGEIGAGHTVTALYELEFQADAPGEGTVATVRVRHKEPRGSGEATEQAFAVDRADMRDRLETASTDFRFAAAVAAFAEILRGSSYGARLNLAWVAEVAREASAGRADREAFVDLVERALEIREG